MRLLLISCLLPLCISCAATNTNSDKSVGFWVDEMGVSHVIQADERILSSESANTTAMAGSSPADDNEGRQVGSGGLEADLSLYVDSEELNNNSASPKFYTWVGADGQFNTAQYTSSNVSPDLGNDVVSDSTPVVINTVSKPLLLTDADLEHVEPIKIPEQSVAITSFPVTQLNANTVYQLNVAGVTTVELLCVVNKAAGESVCMNLSLYYKLGENRFQWAQAAVNVNPKTWAKSQRYHYKLNLDGSSNILLVVVPDKGGAAVDSRVFIKAS